MSGHSKWAQIKHKKAKEDARRGKIFSKLTRAIMVAARQGGGNPETNQALANAVEKAKEYNLPQENIDRAIKRATGELEGVTYEEITYEGYGPGGVAVMVEVMTDNRNRTAAEMRRIFSKHGGNLGESGCVTWMFEKKGVIYILKEKVDEDTLLKVVIGSGADDLQTSDESYQILSSPNKFREVKQAIVNSNIMIEDARITMHPKNIVRVIEIGVAKKVLRFMDELEEHDDVQDVYANFDIPGEVIEEIEA